MNVRCNLFRMTRKLLSIPAILGMLIFPPFMGSFGTADEALAQALKEYTSLIQPGVSYQIILTEEWNGFAYGIAEPGDEARDAFVPLLATQDQAGKWTGIAPGLVRASEFNARLDAFPVQLLDENTKAFLAQQETDRISQSEAVITSASGHRLPWVYQRYSQLIGKGPCYLGGSTCNNSGHVDQLDFSIESSSINGDLIASKPGTVVFLKESSDAGACDYNSWKKANMVVIQHGASEYSWYVHLSYNSIPNTLTVGSAVSYGTKIGVEGNTGYSCGPHLHYMTSTGHGPWTDPANPNDAPWATGIVKVDFVESSWADLVLGSWYESQNASPDLLPPEPPVLLLPTDAKFFNEGSAISLSWSGQASEYYGEVWGDPAGTITFGWQAGSSKNLSAARAGYSYAWHVKGRNINGEGNWSQPSTFTIRPSAPQNLAATASSCTSINLSWEDMSANEEGYKVFRNGILIGTLGGGAQTFQDTGLATNTDFTYTVKSFRGNINSLPSNAITLNTGSCAPGAPILLTPAPAAIIGRFDELLLDWSPANGASEYYVELWGGPTTSMNSGWISPTEFLAGNNFWGGQYFWRVKARNAVGESGWSPTWTLYRRYGTPGTLSALDASLTELTLTWGASADAPSNIDGYRIYRNGSDIAITDANTTQFIDTGLICQTTYRYTVRAYAGELESDPSNLLTIGTLFCPPGPFEKLWPANAATGRPISGLTLRWSTSDLADEYIYCLDKVENSRCDTQWQEAGNTTSAVLGTLEQGVTYYWQVRARNAGGVTNADGGGWRSFTTRVLPPPNDNIQSAQPFSSMPTGLTLDARGATEQADDPGLQACNRLPGKASVWYSYTASRAGDLLLDTDGSDYDTMLAVWSGAPGGALVPVGCNDDAGMSTSGWSQYSSLRSALSKGEIYYIEVSGYNGKIDPSIVPEGEVKGTPGAKGVLALHASFIPYPRPGTFSKLTPSDGVLSRPSSLRLTWEQSNDAEKYIYCIDQIDNKTCDAKWVTTQATSVFLEGLSLDTTYYWQVRAINIGGITNADVGNWWHFHVRPPATNLLSPAEGSTPLSLKPTFRWEAVNSAESYGLQVSQSLDFSAAIIDTSITDTSYPVKVALPAGDLLYWRVRVKSTNGLSAWTPARTLTTPIPPSVPILLSPLSGALLSSYTPSLDWEDSLVPSGAPAFDHYRLQAATNSDFSTLVLDIKLMGLPNTSEYTFVDVLAPGVQFWWRVRAVNLQGEFSGWSKVWSFYTRPTSPVLISPINGGNVDSPRPTFLWEAVTGGSSYQLQVSLQSDYSAPLINVTVSEPGHTATADLPRGKVLYWRVQAEGAIRSQPMEPVEIFNPVNPEWGK